MGGDRDLSIRVWLAPAQQLHFEIGDFRRAPASDGGLTGRYQPLYGEFLNRMPTAIIGSTIRVYWVEEWPELASEPPDELEVGWHLAIADQLLTETRWFDRAAVHYRAYLEVRPKESAVWLRLGVALLESGKLTDALTAFTRAAELDPSPGKLNVRIAETLLAASRWEAAEVFARNAFRQRPNDPKVRELINRLKKPHL